MNPLYAIIIIRDGIPDFARRLNGEPVTFANRENAWQLAKEKLKTLPHFVFEFGTDEEGPNVYLWDTDELPFANPNISAGLDQLKSFLGIK